MRIALRLEYEGTAYHGWQTQLNAPSVQQTLEGAIASLVGRHVGVTGSSRTDAGVHARHQVVHFDVESSIPPEKWAYALNARLPADIRVVASCRARDAFHARFGAAGKVYTYDIWNRRHMAAIGRQTMEHVPLSLDEARMRAAGQAVVGTHDFAAFAASGSIVKDTVRTIHALDVSRGGDVVRVAIHGNGFLYNMVRIIVGTLIDIDHGKAEASALRDMIETRERTAGGVTAAAKGLTLACVYYPERDWVPGGEGIFGPVPGDLRGFALSNTSKL